MWIYFSASITSLWISSESQGPRPKTAHQEQQLLCGWCHSLRSADGHMLSNPWGHRLTSDLQNNVKKQLGTWVASLNEQIQEELKLDQLLSDFPWEVIISPGDYFHKADGFVATLLKTAQQSGSMGHWYDIRICLWTVSCAAMHSWSGLILFLASFWDAVKVRWDRTVDRAGNGTRVEFQRDSMDMEPRSLRFITLLACGLFRSGMTHMHGHTAKLH